MAKRTPSVSCSTFTTGFMAFHWACAAVAPNRQREDAMRNEARNRGDCLCFKGERVSNLSLHIFRAGINELLVRNFGFNPPIAIRPSRRVARGRMAREE